MRLFLFQISGFIFLVLSLFSDAKPWVPLVEQVEGFPKPSDKENADFLSKIRKVDGDFEKIRQLPEQEQIIELSIIVGGRGGNDILQNGIHAYKFRTAREILMNFPNPSVTLTKWMESQRDLRIKQDIEDKQGIRRHEKDADYRPSLVFSAIAQIPTPESVVILGRYLSDRRDEKDMEEFGSFSGGHFRYAAEAFNYMGLKNAPTRQESFSTDEDYILKWQQWFAEVEAGTRSFSFYGSDVEYRLKERTDAVGRKHFETVTVAREASKQPSTESNGAASTAPTLSVWKTVALAISSLLLLVGAWLSLRKRQVAN